MSKHEHGEYNPESKEWYCSYWLSKDLWLDIHDYLPPSPEEIAKARSRTSTKDN